MKSLKFLINPWVNYLFKVKGYPKISYHVTIPLLLTIISIVCLNSLEQVSVIAASTKTFLSFLTGFSFAALIALPSINSKTLSKPMHGNRSGSAKAIPVIWKTTSKGYMVEKPITRKQFLAFLLSYICFMGIVLMGVSFLDHGSSLFGSLVDHSYLKSLRDILHVGFLAIKFIYIYGLFSLIINVLFAVQYFAKISIEDELH